MEFQLVLQFPARDLSDFDELVELEESLVGILGEGHLVDGHDFGSGEMNIFIETNDPEAAFSLCRRIVSPTRSATLKAAYRRISEETYFWIHPEKREGDFKVG